MGDPFESGFALAARNPGGLAGGLGSRDKISPRGSGLCRRRQTIDAELTSAGSVLGYGGNVK